MKMLRAAVPALLAVTLVIAGCGGDADTDSSTTPAASATSLATRSAPRVTPGSDGAPTAPADTPAPAPTATPPQARPGNSLPTQAPPPPPPAPTNTPVPPPVAQPQALTIVASGARFVSTQFTAAVGSAISVTLDNQDAGIAHDLIVYTPSGAVAAQTAAFAGPGQQSAAFTPAVPGNYFFKCSLHPLTMTGAIIVQ